MAVSTGIILCLASVLLKKQLSWFFLPGLVVVFAASWLYIANAPSETPVASDWEQRKPLWAKIQAVAKVSTIFGHKNLRRKGFNIKQKLRLWIFGILAIVTIVLIVLLTFARPAMAHLMKISKINKCLPLPKDIVPPFTNQQHLGGGKDSNAKLESHVPLHNGSNTDALNGITSPFATSMAMIRWNARRMERVPLLMKYAPFFHTVHISMPDMMPEKTMDFHNLTHDQYADGETIYLQLAHTMKLILDTQPKITGLLYFHFDSWVDPLAFGTANTNNIWLPAASNTRVNTISGPRFICMKDTREYPGWWGWERGWHKRAIRALDKLKELGVEYTYKEGEWCVAWTDVYYIPRRFFADYIFLSYLFGCVDLFHEVAIPTMLHVIDQSRRPNPYLPIIDRLGDCFGSCCDSSATVEDVLWTRCGHRLDYLNQGIVDAHYSRLDNETALLMKGP
jgi:hypothetical protein